MRVLLLSSPLSPRHHHHRRMRLLFLTLILSSCSPKPAEQNALPRYSDMGAAADAGNLTHETTQK